MMSGDKESERMSSVIDALERQRWGDLLSKRARAFEMLKDDAFLVGFLRAVRLFAEQLVDGKKALFFGNGGSAADAQHLAAEFSVRFCKDRPALSALALSSDSAVITAAGNDFGFETIFSRQVEAFGRPGDIVLGFSTSGNSPNVVRAIETARVMGLHTVALTGDKGELRSKVDIALCMPSCETAIIQELYLCVGHLLCAYVELEIEKIKGCVIASRSHS